MAIQELVLRDGRFLGWSHEETLAKSETGDPVKIPSLLAGQRISVRTIAGTGDAKVQSTISSDAKVAAGTAVWDDWSIGAEIGTNSANLDAPISALRAVVGATSTASVVFEVLI